MKRALVPMLLLAVAATAVADGAAHLKPEAQRHLDAALAAYKDKTWPAAIREFEQAYALDPDTNLLYAIAQAYRFDNQCSKALDYYKRYLQSRQCSQAPDRAVCESQIVAANTGISLCASAQPPVQDHPVTPQPPPTPPQSPSLSPSPPPSAPTAFVGNAGVTAESSPWYRDGTGDALAAGGVIGIGVGIGYLAKASDAQSAAKSATLRNDFLHDLSEATSERRIGAVTLGLGAVLAAGGVFFYIHHDRKAALVGTTDGHTIGIAGAF